MIELGKPYVEVREDGAYLCARVRISADTVQRYLQVVATLPNCKWLVDDDYPPAAWEESGGVLWFACPVEYAPYLCSERSNAFVVAMLWYAIMTGSDIAYEAPMSQRLHDGITQMLMPELEQNGFAPVKLVGPLTSDPVSCAGGVVTGLTGGVDSAYTVNCYGGDDAPGGMRITHLAYNTGNYMVASLEPGYSAAALFQQGARAYQPIEANVQAYAQSFNLPYITMRYNIETDYYRGGAIYMAMYRYFACAIALEHLYSTYLSASSGHEGNVYEASLTSPTQHYEDLLCKSLQTETFRYVSSDSVSRMEKLAALADDEAFQQHIFVCFNYLEDGTNCGECYGCMKTMIPLDMLGKLDGFGNRFDVPAYYANRERVFESLIRFSWRPEASSARETVRQLLELARTHPSQAGDLFTAVHARLAAAEK